MTGLRLLDERAVPPLRSIIGSLLTTSETVDFAVTSIRLASLDLTPREIAGPRRCRVLLGRLDASTLFDTGTARGGSMDGLIRWARSGRLLVRSAGIGAWTPDFSVYHDRSGSRCLLGAHYFGSPYLTIGPSFTVVTEDRRMVRLLGARFDGLWERSHDVLPAIVGVLERVGVESTSAG